MTKFNAAEIASVIQAEIEKYTDAIRVEEVGTVLEVGDGIARVYGLSNVMAGEMVQFPNGAIGLAFNLEEGSVGVTILGDYLEIQEGDEVKALGKLLSVPVGEAVIGRVVDPLGNPLDGKGPIAMTETRPVEFTAPGVAGRQPVKEPLQTGIKAIDAMTPDRPRPARADHRRPQDGQNDDRHRHDHQPEDFRREVLLCGDRPEGFVGPQHDQSARRQRRDGLHHRRHGRGQHSGPAAIRRPLMPAPRWPSTSCTRGSTP